MRTKVKFKGFVMRFITIYLAIYLVCLFLFLFVSDYQATIDKNLIFKQIFREMDAIQFLKIPLFQIVRAFLIAAVLYPFHLVIIYEPYGWLKLFGLLFILTGLGSSVIGIGSIEGYLYSHLGLSSPIAGLVQTIIVLFLTSFFFTKWMKSSLRKTKFYGRL